MVTGGEPRRTWLIRCLTALVLVAGGGTQSVAAQALVAGAGTQSVAARALAPGAVVGLHGTPHLWIMGDDGALHWAGDTRALAGKLVNWGDRYDVTPEELTTYTWGDPWLSAGLVKMGDPIYFVKWETEWTEPMLLRFQSVTDIEWLGISSENYADLVFDAPTWQARYGFDLATLRKGQLRNVAGA